jgi:hypothetical protein
MNYKGIEDNTHKPVDGQENSYPNNRYTHQIRVLRQEGIHKRIT